MIDTATQPPAMKGAGRISSALPAASPNWWVRAMRRFTRNRVSMMAAGILVGICLLSVFAPVVTPHNPAKQYRKEGLKGGMPVGPSAQFLLGTDSNGRDMFTRLLYGGRAAFLVGVVASALAVSTGVAIGSFAGISGGWVDMLLMREHMPRENLNRGNAQAARGQNKFTLAQGCNLGPKHARGLRPANQRNHQYRDAQPRF